MTRPTEAEKTTCTRQEGMAPVFEADVVITGFHFAGPLLLAEWASMGLTPSEALELLLLADLAPSEVDALFDTPGSH